MPKRARKGRKGLSSCGAAGAVRTPLTTCLPARIPAPEALVGTPTRIHSQVPAPEGMAALSRELALFNRRIEEVLSGERIAQRVVDDRKEMWVLLGALLVVVVFCFVAFYLNQAEVRDMHGSLQAEIDQAGQSTVATLERRIAGLRLEKVGETQVAMDRFLKEKERRDDRRLGQILEEVQRLPERDGAALREDLRSLEERIAELRRVAEDLRRLQEVPSDRVPRGAPPDAALASGAGGPRGPFAGPEQHIGQFGRAAQAPNGAPAHLPPVPATWPPGHDLIRGPSDGVTGRDGVRAPEDPIP